MGTVFEGGGGVTTLPRDRKIKSAMAGQRRREYIERFLDAVDADAAFTDILRVLHEAMRKAELSARVPDPARPGHFAYAMIPDHTVRITAARVFAELLGLVGSRDAVNVTLGEGASINVSVDQRVLELESLGVPRDVLLAELRTVVEQAEAAQPTAPTVIEPSQPVS